MQGSRGSCPGKLSSGMEQTYSEARDADAREDMVYDFMDAKIKNRQNSGAAEMTQ